MADQLAIWNAALAHVGERRLASLTEPREPARVLADEWDAAVRGCLVMAPWSFATRTQAVSAGGAGAGPFANAFTKPSDWLRTADIAADAGLSVPLDGYLEEGGYWYATAGAIWVRYVSSDPAYGYNVANWHQPFADVVALALAARICRRLTGAADMLGDVVKLRDAAGQEALAYEEQTAARQYPSATAAGETRLAIYNAALAHLGRARTPSLTSAADAVRALNDQWRDAVRHSLQAAAWGFACATVSLAPSGAPALGLQAAFPKPTDWLRTANLALDVGLSLPVPSYVEDGTAWSAQTQTLVVRYVSSDPAFGFNLALWTPRFCDLVALRLAELSAGRLAPPSKDGASDLVKMRMAAAAEAEGLEAEAVERIPAPGMGPATRLQVSNDALARLGIARLASLTDVSPVARALNDQYTSALFWCLERAPWNFAAVIAVLPPAAGTGSQGYSQTFPKPADWVLTLNVAADGALQQPVAGYIEEGPFWYASSPQLGVRYVSSAAGGDPTRWPPTFRALMALRLAELCVGRIASGAGDLAAGLSKLRDAAEDDARAVEAQTVGRTFPVTGAGLTQLQAYNDALAHLGLPRIVGLTDATETVRALNDQYGVALRWCLQRGPWDFAALTEQLSAGGGAPLRAGFANALPKAADHLLTLNVAADAALQTPLDQYVEEGAYFFADPSTITVRFVSSTLGADPTRWSPLFTDLLALRLAELCCGRLAPDAKAMMQPLAQARDQAEAAAMASERESVARLPHPANQAVLTRLQVSNDALAHLGRARIASLTEVGATTRALNDQWLGSALWVLEQASWQFAAVEATIAADGATPPNPMTSAFVQPADWLMTLDAAQDAQFTIPIYDLVEENGVWFADVNPLNVRYISSLPSAGLNIALWPPLFRDLVALRLAAMCAGRLGAEAKDLAPMMEAARGRAIDTELSRQQRSFPENATGATVLRIYNAALGHLGRPRLASLTEVSPTMRLLTDAWATEVRWALEQGPWTFAIRAIMIGPFAASGPTFGYTSGFKKPDDWLQTVLVSEYDDMREGATRYADETGWWFSNAPGLFIRYVSTGPNFGMNLPRWPAAFADLVAARMAEKIAPRLDAASTRVAELIAQRQDAMKRLRATDALNTPPVFPPEGSWTAARRGRRSAGRRFGDGPGGPGIPLTGDTTLSGDSDLPIGSDFVPRISG